MKKINVFALSALLVVTLATFARAELLTEQYGVNISDANPYKDGNNLYQLFNRYFSDQLGTEGLYTSSNALFNDRGVDPTTDWTTSHSQMVGAFKVASLGHEFKMLGEDGNTVGSIMSVGGTTNIYSSTGITDLSGSSVVNIADGLHLSFQLDAYNGSKMVYSWSSNVEENLVRPLTKGDGMIHMIALDITDLYNAKYNTSNNSVYMFGWEDLHLTAAGGGSKSDWDYQDFVAIMTNLTPESVATTPEPATMLMFLVGGGFTSVVAWRKRQRNVA